MNKHFLSFAIIISIFVLLSSCNLRSDIVNTTSTTTFIHNNDNISEKIYSVASSDSSESIKSASFFVCDGINDDIEINQALKSNAGSEISLSEGTYNITGGIIIPSNTSLTGSF